MVPPDYVLKTLKIWGSNQTTETWHGIAILHHIAILWHMMIVMSHVQDPTLVSNYAWNCLYILSYTISHPYKAPLCQRFMGFSMNGKFASGAVEQEEAGSQKVPEASRKILKGFFPGGKRLQKLQDVFQVITAITINYVANVACHGSSPMFCFLFLLTFCLQFQLYVRVSCNEAKRAFLQEYGMQCVGRIVLWC